MASQPSSQDDRSGSGHLSGAGHLPGESGLDAELDRAVPTGEAEAFLIVVQGSTPGRVFALTHNTVLVGRIDGADVFISDPSVSGRHARIINGTQGFEIEDLESTNGTFVGGQRVRRCRLRNGDQVRIGSVEFTFRIDKLVDPTVALLPTSARLPPRVFEGAVARSTALRGALPAVVGPGFRERRSYGRDDVRDGGRDGDEGPSLSEIIHKIIGAYRFLAGHAAVIAALATAGTVIGFLSVFVLMPASTASSLVKLQPQMRSNPVDTEKVAEDAPQFFEGPERAFVNPALLRETLRKLDGAEPDEARVSSVASRLKFEGLDEPHLFRASYKESLLAGRRKWDPAQLLSTHLRNYVESEIAKALKVFTAEVEFLRSQLKSVEADLARISSERTAFRQENADRLPEEALQTHSSRFQLESRRAELLAQIRRMQEDLDSERKQYSLEGSLSQTKFQSSQVYRQSLATVNQKLTEAYARGLADGHPEVRQLLDEKKRVEKLIDGEMTMTVSPVDREANSGLQAQQGRIGMLRGQLTAARADLVDTEKSLGTVRTLVGDLPRVEAHLQDLNHRQEAISRLHTQLFDKLKKAELQLNLERVSAQSRYETLSAPRVDRPGKVKTGSLRCAVGLCLGLMIAAVVIAIREGRRLVSRALETYDDRSPSTSR